MRIFLMAALIAVTVTTVALADCTLKVQLVADKAITWTDECCPFELRITDSAGKPIEEVSFYITEGTLVPFVIEGSSDENGIFAGNLMPDGDPGDYRYISLDFPEHPECSKRLRVCRNAKGEYIGSFIGVGNGSAFQDGIMQWDDLSQGYHYGTWTFSSGDVYDSVVWDFNHPEWYRTKFASELVNKSSVAFQANATACANNSATNDHDQTLSASVVSRTNFSWQGVTPPPDFTQGTTNYSFSLVAEAQAGGCGDEAAGRGEAQVWASVSLPAEARRQLDPSIRTGVKSEQEGGKNTPWQDPDTSGGSPTVVKLIRGGNSFTTVHPWKVVGSATISAEGDGDRQDNCPKGCEGYASSRLEASCSATAYAGSPGCPEMEEMQ